MDRYLKIFFITGIPFGIIFGTLYHFQRGFPASLVSGLLGGIFVGSTLSLILGLLHRKSIQNMPYNDYEEALDVKHERKLIVPLPYDHVFNLCLDSLTEIKKSKINKLDRDKGKIRARAGMTPKTLGDRIRLKVEKIDDEKTRVIVRSEPVSPTTAVDYGKNLENVERITAYLEENGGAKTD